MTLSTAAVSAGALPALCRLSSLRGLSPSLLRLAGQASPSPFYTRTQRLQAADLPKVMQGLALNQALNPGLR